MHNKPRIVFINHWAGKLGGAEYSLIDLISESVNHAETHLITSEEGRLTEIAQSAGSTCHSIRCGQPLSSIRRDHLLWTLMRSIPAGVAFIVFSLKVARTIRRIAPDVIHANVPKSHITLMLCRLLGGIGTPMVFHVREIFKKNSFAALLYRFLFPGKNSVVFAISEAVKVNLPLSMQTVARVIYNGICIPDHLASRPLEPIRLLYLGRIVPWKGCHLLIEMVAALLPRHPERRIELSLVGDTIYWTPDYRIALREQISRLKLDAVCSLLPHTSNPGAAFDGHHIFCSMSQAEPFGRVLAEAQAHGLPVIAYDGGGVREVVEDGNTGILVPFGDQEKFINAIEWLAADRLLMQKMGEAGSVRAKRLFNRDLQVPKIVKEILRHGNQKDK